MCRRFIITKLLTSDESRTYIQMLDFIHNVSVKKWIKNGECIGFNLKIVSDKFFFYREYLPTIAYG